MPLQDTLIARASKRERIEQRRQASVKKKWDLAQKLVDPAMLVAALRFYTRLIPAELTPVGAIDAIIHARPRRWRHYLSAARRVCGVEFHDRGATIRLPRNIWHVRLPRVGLKLNLRPGDRHRFENLPADLIVNDAIRSFALDHNDILERTQLFLRDGYRPSIAEIIGRPTPLEGTHPTKVQPQWWISPGEEQPGPFAGNADVDWPTRQELPDDPDDDPDLDDEPAFNSPFRRRISRREELRAILAEDKPESIYGSRIKTRVLYRPAAREPLPMPHPFAPATEEPQRGLVTHDSLIKGRIAAHLSRKAG